MLVYQRVLLLMGFNRDIRGHFMGSEAKFLWVIMVIVKTIASFGPPISQLTEVISSHSSTPP